MVERSYGRVVMIMRRRLGDWWRLDLHSSKLFVKRDLRRETHSFYMIDTIDNVNTVNSIDRD